MYGYVYIHICVYIYLAKQWSQHKEIPLDYSRRCPNWNIFYRDPSTSRYHTAVMWGLDGGCFRGLDVGVKGPLIAQ